MLEGFEKGLPQLNKKGFSGLRPNQRKSQNGSCNCRRGEATPHIRRRSRGQDTSPTKQVQSSSWVFDGISSFMVELLIYFYLSLAAIDGPEDFAAVDTKLPINRDPPAPT